MEAYGLLKNPRLKLIEPRMATLEELYLVHDEDYVQTIKKYSNTPKLFIKDHPNGLYGLGTMDDPVFPGMFEASALVSGASIVGAELLINDDSYEHVFNFGGGLHHAGRAKSSGFCIFNDAALAIQKMHVLAPKKKILYLDVDAHHGDGVQWIFYKDPDVLTLSIHQDGHSLFPGTGFMDERGEGEGKNYKVNFPIYPGTYDDAYLNMFRKLVPKIIEKYKPDILVSQLGVDTHYSDPLTMLGLSTTGHERIFKLIHQYAHEYCNGKWLALGGGGYLMTVVPRSWTMALAIMLDQEIPDDIPSEWVDFCADKIKDEEIPYKLRDHNMRAEYKLVKDPLYSVRIEDQIDKIEQYVNEQVLPNL